MNNTLLSKPPFTRLQNKPKIQQRVEGMTCILGMACQDGIVLGADKEINQGTSKYAQSKIIKRTTWGETPYFLACTSFDMGNADQWITTIKRRISWAEQPPDSPSEPKRSITKAVRDVYQEMLDTPKGKESGTAFIWAFKHAGRYKLHHYCNGNDVSNKPWMVDGSGFDHIVGLLGQMHNSNMPLMECATVAVYLLKVAKMRASGVGEPSEILMLNHSGECSMLNPSFVKDLEDCYWRLHTGIEPLIHNYTQWGDKGFEGRVKNFAKQTIEDRVKIRDIYGLPPDKKTCNPDDKIYELMG